MNEHKPIRRHQLESKRPKVIRHQNFFLNKTGNNKNAVLLATIIHLQQSETTSPKSAHPCTATFTKGVEETSNCKKRWSNNWEKDVTKCHQSRSVCMCVFPQKSFKSYWQLLAMLRCIPNGLLKLECGELNLTKMTHSGGSLLGRAWKEGTQAKGTMGEKKGSRLLCIPSCMCKEPPWSSSLPGPAKVGRRRQWSCPPSRRLRPPPHPVPRRAGFRAGKLGPRVSMASLMGNWAIFCDKVVSLSVHRSPLVE